MGQRTILASLFYLTGYYLKGHLTTNIYMLIPLFILLLLGYYITPMSMMDFTWYNVSAYWIIATSGTLLIYIMSTYVHKLTFLKKILIYTGNHTLEILTWHFVGFKIVQYSIIKLEQLPIQQLACFPTMYNYDINTPKATWLIWMGYSIAGVFIPLIMVYSKEIISTYLVKR